MSTFGRHHSHALALIAGACLLPFAAHAADQAASTADTGANAPVLAEVVVTAQHRAENAQIVPISISTVSAKTIQNSNLQEVTDLQYLVPGLQYDPTNGAAFQIRGVGSTSFDFSNEKSVNLVVDDVVMDGRRDNGLIGLSDIQRVDVLMGPQGTLFGKNSTSGVISITTADPVLGRWSGQANASYGERNDTIDNLTLNVPLGETAALRVSGFHQGQDGFGEYTTLHKKLGSFNEYGGRAKLLWRPIPHLQVILAGDYEQHWDNSIRTAVTGASASLTAEEMAYGVTPGPQNASTADSSEGIIKTSSSGETLHVQYQVAGNTLTSITAYRQTTYDNNTPVDLVPSSVFAYIPYNDGALKTSKVSEELRLASPTGQFIEYSAGLFYDRLTADQTQLQWATLGSPTVVGGKPLTTLYNVSGANGQPGDEDYFQAVNTSYAAFGQLKFNLTDKLSILFGGRYTDDRNSQRLSFLTIPSAPITGTTDTFIDLYNAPFRQSGSVSGNNFSYRIAPEYRITPTEMVYATYSTGYKPGGVAFVSNNYDPYKPETVQSFEVGEKSEFFDHRLRVNFDLFYENFKDFQTSLLTNVPGNAPAGAVLTAIVIGNAGGLKSEGAETNVTFRATSELTLNVAATYADTYFTDYVYNTTTNYSGTDLTNAPRWMISSGVDYDHEFSPTIELHGHLDYAYRTDVYTVVGEPAYSKIPGYGLLNGRIGVTISPANIQVGIYARNLLNTYFSTGEVNYGAPGYLHYSTLDAYRTVGVFAKYQF